MKPGQQSVAAGRRGVQYLCGGSSMQFFPCPFGGHRRMIDLACRLSEALRMKVLSIDIGGTNVKILATGESAPRKFPSGPELTPSQMVTRVRELANDWAYDVVSIGYPGPVDRGRPTADPRNLGKGWVDFNFAGAFKRPVKIVNDAAMQALGSYKGGTMLFLGLGTGIGAAV